MERKPRQYAFELNGASRETDSYEIEIPAGFVVDDLPDPVKVDVGFASYQSKIEARGTQVNYWRELIVRELKVEPEQIGELRKFEGMIGADENAAVVLKRKE